MLTKFESSHKNIFYITITNKNGRWFESRSVYENVMLKIKIKLSSYLHIKIEKIFTFHEMHLNGKFISYQKKKKIPL